MNLIASADDNWGIGNGPNLLCRLKPDMMRFKRLTEGGAVIMGRKTFMTLPNKKPLPNRVNIVLSRDSGLAIEGGAVVNTAGQLIEAVGRLSGLKLWVIGGAEIYKLLMPLCERAYITHIHGSFEADAYLCNLDALGWRVAERSDVMEYGGHRFEYITYVNSCCNPL